MAWGPFTATSELELCSKTDLAGSFKEKARECTLSGFWGFVSLLFAIRKECTRLFIALSVLQFIYVSNFILFLAALPTFASLELDTSGECGGRRVLLKLRQAASHKRIVCGMYVPVGSMRLEWHRPHVAIWKLQCGSLSLVPETCSTAAKSNKIKQHR